MRNYFKLGLGAGFIILGLYIINKFTNDIISVIGGIICISIGIGLIASQR